MAATRARDETTPYVATEDLLDLDADPPDDSARTARQVLEAVLATEGGEASATETIRTTLAEAETLPVLVSRYDHALAIAIRERYAGIAERTLGGDLAGRLVADPAWPAMCHALISAERGLEPPPAPYAVTALGQLDTAESAARVLATRLDHYL